MSDTIIRSNLSRRLKLWGHRGMAIECMIVAFLVAFASLQVLLVVGTSAASH